MGAVNNAATLATTTQFRNMALAGMVYTARTVLTEDQGTANHARRVWLASRVIANPTNYADTISWVMAADPVIAVYPTAPAVDENVLLNGIATAWDYLAGTSVFFVP